MRTLAMVATALLVGAVPAAAQGMDILTGEPVRPPAAHPRPEPEIVNAPHAPRQSAARAGDTLPMEIYVAPQIGTGSGGYPGRLPQDRRY